MLTLYLYRTALRSHVHGLNHEIGTCQGLPSGLSGAMRYALERIRVL